MLKLSAVLALLFAIVLGVGEAVRNSEQMQYWPFWVVDYIAVALLAAGGVATLRARSARGPRLLTAAWGFATAMFYMSFFGHLHEIRNSPEAVAETNAQSAIDEPQLTIIIGVMFAATIAGLGLSLAGRSPQNT